MAFDGITTAAVTAECAALLVGGRISKIAQPEEDELILTIKNAKGTYRLLLSASAGLPLIYLTQDNPLSPMTAPNFCMLLRKHIGNSRILSIEQPGLERVVRFRLEHLDEMGDLRRKSLVIEIMGKYSNIIFLDENDVIVDSIKRVSAAVSSVREVLPGREYFIPNTMNKKNPLEAAPSDVAEILTGPQAPANMLMKEYTGISTVIAVEAAARAGVDDTPCEMLSDAQRQAVAEAFCAMMDDVKNGRFAPCIAWHGDTPQEFAAVNLTSYGDCRVEPHTSMSEVCESFYRARANAARMRQKSVTLRKLTANCIERTAKKYDLQVRQLADTEKREKYRIYGELLHTYGYDIPEGAKSAELLNYYTGENIRVPLDETLTPAENATRYFDRYTKLKRTYEALTDLTRETADELEHLRTVAASIEMAESDADLNEIRRELASCGYIRHQSTGGRKDNRQKSRPYHYVSSDGFDIYVGRNNFQNDELTFHFAQGGDIWMHAKKAHGSHVIIRTGGREVPDRTYEEAGGLAAWFSEAREADKTEIDYIEKKFVKKPAGGKPGFVIYHTNYSLMAHPSADLKKLND